ncbi:hypothetical protein B0H16DRAFT_1460710 [Mycena metata]|uniref:Uncharacterized protein n=1 Tax=Mycena metata TaxID=1033252 RepID=A0AAD7IW74_9AGAR|nr:hypothetical protein B0H16DRAFT_1460710 [Mycena metata]
MDDPSGMIYPSRPSSAPNDGFFACALPLYTHSTFKGIDEHEVDGRSNWIFLKHPTDSAAFTDLTSYKMFILMLNDHNYTYEDHCDPNKVVKFKKILDVAQEHWQFCVSQHAHPTTAVQQMNETQIVPEVELHRLVFHDPTKRDVRLRLPREHYRLGKLFPCLYEGQTELFPRQTAMPAAPPVVPSQSAPSKGAPVPVAPSKFHPSSNGPRGRTITYVPGSPRPSISADALDPLYHTLKRYKDASGAFPSATPDASSSAPNASTSTPNASTSTPNASTSTPNASTSCAPSKTSSSAPTASPSSNGRAALSPSPEGPWFLLSDGQVELDPRKAAKLARNGPGGTHLDIKIVDTLAQAQELRLQLIQAARAAGGG